MTVPAMDPWTAAFFSAASVAKPAGPSNATSVNTPTFDSSGWNVNFGAGTIESARAQTPLPTGASTSGVNAYLPYVLIGLGALVVWRMTRRKG